MKIFSLNAVNIFICYLVLISIGLFGLMSIFVYVGNTSNVFLNTIEHYLTWIYLSSSAPLAKRVTIWQLKDSNIKIGQNKFINFLASILPLTSIFIAIIIIIR